jgi:energy-coupling factor transport system permease protein
MTFSNQQSFYHEEKMNLKYTTRDIVIVAVIAAIAGVINTGTGQVWYLANSSLGPLGGALLQGAFMWAYILVVWLVRKPGAALFLGLIETSVEVLLGNASGIGTLGWGLTQGLAVEAVVDRWLQPPWAVDRHAGWRSLFSVWHPMDRIFYGWDPSYASDVWMAIPINLISGAVFSGLIGYYLATAIAKTGLVRSAART